MVLQGFARTFSFWGFCGQYRKTVVFNDMFFKKSLKSMVLSTFNFWGFCGQYRDFLYYFREMLSQIHMNLTKIRIIRS